MCNSRKLLLSVGGNMFYERFIKNMLADEVEFCNPGGAHGQDGIYWVGGRGPELLCKPGVWIAKKPMLIIHWIGSDVLFEMRRKPRRLQSAAYWKLWNVLFNRKYALGGILNLAGAPWLVEELASCGIHAHYLPISSLDVDTLPKVDDPSDKEIDFVTYLPRGKCDFYGGSTVVTLAQRMPHYSFEIVQPDIARPEETNLRHLPINVRIRCKTEFDKMPDMYSRAKCFLRFTQHDGLSLSVLESLYFKLHVAWTYPFPHTHHVRIDDIDRLERQLAFVIGNWEPNARGHDFVLEEYSIHRCKERFRQIIRSVGC